MYTNDTPTPTAPEPAAQPGAVTRGKLALVAGAVALVAAGGIGGFVLGQSSSATAGTTSDSGPFRGGGPPGMTGEGFSGQVPGAGGPISGGTGTGAGTDSGTNSGSGTGPTT